MRTKALLLAAAFAAAGVATSVAQVYSVNAVGYVNKDIPRGFSLIANPLEATDNKLGSLFKNIAGGPPEGMRVFAFRGGKFEIAQYEPLDSAFIPAEVANLVILPGEGVFVHNPDTTAKTVTFVGQVPQGNLSNPLPTGFAIRANQVPQAVRPDTVGLTAPVANEGDRYFKFNTTTQSYQIWQFEPLDNAWIGPSTGLPVLEVGEAFFYNRVGAPGSWNRTFSVNG